jgi:hypothetical protein
MHYALPPRRRPYGPEAALCFTIPHSEIRIPAPLSYALLFRIPHSDFRIPAPLSYALLFRIPHSEIRIPAPLSSVNGTPAI